LREYYDKLLTSPANRGNNEGMANTERAGLQIEQTHLVGLNRSGSVVIEADAFSSGPATASDKFATLSVRVRIPEHRHLEGRLQFDSWDGTRRLWNLQIVNPSPDQRSTEVTSEALRALPLGRVYRELDEMIARDSGVSPSARRLTKGFRESPRPGKRQRPRAQYAAVAAEYVKHLGERAPVRVTADRLGYSESTIRAVLNKARRFGLLTETDQGRAGGRLTPTAEALLKGDE
jgi:hypothetical protein